MCVVIIFPNNIAIQWAVYPLSHPYAPSRIAPGNALAVGKGALGPVAFCTSAVVANATDEACAAREFPRSKGGEDPQCTKAG